LTDGLFAEIRFGGASDSEVLATLDPMPPAFQRLTIAGFVLSAVLPFLKN
jgi:hypothetical protein